MIDLHVHSSCSDGTDAPRRLVELAAAAGCATFALTDHDTVSGVPEAQEHGRNLGVEVLPGVELSAHVGHENVHLLGYFIDIEDSDLQEFLRNQRALRDQRNLILIDKLADIGVDLTIDDVREESVGETLGRPHFAAALVRSGQADSVADAFTRYLGPGAPTHVNRRDLSAGDAVAAIQAAGGVVVWAHPLIGRRHNKDAVESTARQLADLGVAGIECFYSVFEDSERNELKDLTRSLGMTPTGGSDYHGTFKPALSLGTGRGDLAIEQSVLDELRTRQQS